MRPHYQPPLARRRNRGIAMLLVLVVVFMVTILATEFQVSQSTTTGIMVNATRHAQARYIAETALALAIADVKANTAWREQHSNGTWVANQAFADGSFSIKGEDGTYNASTDTVSGDGSLIDDPSDPLVLTVTGTYGGVTHTTHSHITCTGNNLQSVMMVVRDAASLSPGETWVQNYLQSVGWTVNLLSETATQADYDTAEGNSDIIYICASVTNTNLAAMVRNGSLGVVSAAGSLQDDLGVSSAAATALTGTQIDIVNTTHYITSTLSSGNNSITSSSQPLGYITGSLATGATILAEKPGANNGMLVVVDAGGILQSGGTAPGRMVFLPWGGTTFDNSTLTATGHNILRRALDWADGLDQTGSTTVNRIAVNDTLIIQNTGKIDSFQSSRGAYGGANIGASALASTNSTSKDKVTVDGGTIQGNVQTGVGSNPSSVIKLAHGGTISGTKTAMTTKVTIPTAIAPNIGGPTGNKTYSSGITTISANLHCGSLTIKGNAIVQISGNVIIVADGAIMVQDTAQIQLLPGASLALYGKNNITFKHSAQVNVNTATPGACIIYEVNGKPVIIQDSALVYGVVIVPKNKLTVTNGQLCGAYMGNQLAITGTGIVSLDTSTTPVIPGPTGTVYTYTPTWIEQP